MNFRQIQLGGAIKDVDGKIVALSNYAVPPYQISYGLYTLKKFSNFLMLCIFGYFFLKSIAKRIVGQFYVPNLHDITWHPHYVGELFSSIVFLVYVISFFRSVYIWWRNLNLVKYGTPSEVEFYDIHLIDPFGTYLSFINRNSFFSGTYGITVDKNDKLDFLELVKDKKYDCYLGTYSRGQTILIVIDRMGFKFLKTKS